MPKRASEKYRKSFRNLNLPYPLVTHQNFFRQKDFRRIFWWCFNQNIHPSPVLVPVDQMHRNMFRDLGAIERFPRKSLQNCWNSPCVTCKTMMGLPFLKWNRSAAETTVSRKLTNPLLSRINFSCTTFCTKEKFFYISGDLKKNKLRTQATFACRMRRLQTVWKRNCLVQKHHFLPKKITSQNFWLTKHMLAECFCRKLSPKEYSMIMAIFLRGNVSGTIVGDTELPQ